MWSNRQSSEIFQYIVSCLLIFPLSMNPETSFIGRKRPDRKHGGHKVNPAQRLVHSANISTQVVTDKQAKFTVRPKFLEVIRSIPNVDQKKTVFSYEEVTLLLSTYILSNKKKFFDTRNIKLAMVEDDPLGEAFNVKAFHRCQVNALLRGQLIPVEPDYVDTAVVITSSSPGCGANIVERPVPIVSDKGPAPTPDNLMGSAAGMPPLPAFPALVKAQTMPASNSLVRKRSDSGSEEESKRVRLNNILNRSQSENDETETETIYSCQGNDTVTVNDESEEETDDDDCDVNEYEPETCDEAERPPQAMGKAGDDSSSGSDSDVDINFSLKKSDLKKVGEEQKKESVYDGDKSEDEKELDSYDSELETADLWTCLECKKPNKPYIRYCQTCWKVRRGWLDYDGRKKRKGSVKTASHESDTETDGTGDSGDSERPRMDSQDSGLGESQEIEFTTDKGKLALNRSLSLDMSSSSSSPVPSLASADSGYISSSSTQSQLCLLCCHRPKNASLVHGRIGHQVCCYQCAKKLWKKRSDCPVCRRTVERIIKIIPA